MARDEAARRAHCLSAGARKLDAFWMVRETPRKFCLCAGETSALYLYGTYMKLCEGLVSGQLVGIASVSKKMTMSLCCP